VPYSPLPQSREATPLKSEPYLRRASPSPGLTADELVRCPTNIDTLVCELCNGGHLEDKIILCDRCDKGFHMFCLTPPLTSVPEGDWMCPLCLTEESDSYAFKDGKVVSMKEFERTAQDFKRAFWGGDSRARKVSYRWEIVEIVEVIVEVVVGGDSGGGSGGDGGGDSGGDSGGDGWETVEMVECRDICKVY
jgi:hypothetical protein